jgi:hypothetical protein
MIISLSDILDNGSSELILTEGISAREASLARRVNDWDLEKTLRERVVVLEDDAFIDDDCIRRMGLF